MRDLDLEFGEKIAVVMYLVATVMLTAGTFLNNGGIGGALIVFGLCIVFGSIVVLLWTQANKY